MTTVQITGCSGAGKTTIAAELARRGLAAIDADGDPLLARSVNAAGIVVKEPETPDFAWLSRHSWAWDPARLDELIRAAAPATLYVCGGADNQLELADRFTHVFLLEIDEPTMLARVDARPDNDWGRIGDTREYLRRKLPELQARLRASGAIPIDARPPLDHVADAILFHTPANDLSGRGLRRCQVARSGRPARRITRGFRGGPAAGVAPVAFPLPAAPPLIRAPAGPGRRADAASGAGGEAGAERAWHLDAGPTGALPRSDRADDPPDPRP